MLASKIEAEELSGDDLVAVEKVEVGEESEEKTVGSAQVSDEFEALLKEFGEFQMQCQGLEQKVKKDETKWLDVLKSEVDEDYEDVEVMKGEEQQESK